MRRGIPCDYVQVSVVGNEVPHFPIHLIPRTHTAEVSLTRRPLIPYKNTEEMQQFATIIRAHIQKA